MDPGEPPSGPMSLGHLRTLLTLYCMCALGLRLDLELRLAFRVLGFHDARRAKFEVGVS